MVFRGIVKKYIEDFILLTKFKNIIGMKEKFAQNMEVTVSILEFLLKTKGTFGDFFVWNFNLYDGF